MTTSIWNDQEISKQFAGCRNLREIIAKLESELGIQGEVICEIRVNGVFLSEADEEKFAESAREEIHDLAVRSNRPENLIVDAIRSAGAFVPDLQKSCLETADLFRGSDLGAAQKLFHEALDGCQWLVDTLMHVRGAASGVGAPIGCPERWFEAEKMITKVVRDLSEAYTKSDYVLVADLLEYELTGALAIWTGVIEDERGRRDAATGRAL